MKGIQKTVAEGLRYMASKVEQGAYGRDDSAFSDDDSRSAFLDDLQDEVISKTE